MSLKKRPSKLDHQKSFPYEFDQSKRKDSLRRNNSVTSISKNSIVSFLNDQDIKTHPIFCQLSLLSTQNSAKKTLWKEKSRLIRYIETVEDNGLWSKPYVSTISLNKLGDLRQYFEKGTVLFNCIETELDHVYDSLVDYLIADEHLEAAQAGMFREVLNSPHIHQYQKEFIRELNFGTKHKITKKTKEKLNQETVQEVEEVQKKTRNNSLNSFDTVDEEDDDDNDSVLSYESDFENILKEQSKKGNLYFKKKIPEDSLGAHFMVGTCDFLKKEIIALVELVRPTTFENFIEVNIPTKYIFVALGPKNKAYKMEQIGRCCATLFSDELFQSDLVHMRSKPELLAAFDQFLDQSTVIPPGEWDTTIRLKPPAKVPSKAERVYYKKTKKIKIDKTRYEGHNNDPCLVRTGRFCGGLIEDLKRKLPVYKSDFTDALNFQCIPVIGFLYFACLTPIVTFGGLLGYATDNNMGAIESLIAGLISGVLYSLFSGQPMTILGSTGPVLVFETILNTMSKSYGIDYMGFRVWVGLWVALFLLIIVAIDLSFLVQYITKFTEESFAILIAIIFVSESVKKLLNIRHSYKFSSNPYVYADVFSNNNTDCFRCIKTEGNVTEIVPDVVNEIKCESMGHNYRFLEKCEHIPDVFFFSVILYLLTFVMAMGLRNIKFTSFATTGIRQKLANFGVVITIATMVFLDYEIGLDTPKLHVPSEFHPTIPDRGWFIDPIQRQGDRWWLAFAAIPPALLATILIFMDQQITAVIVNRESNKLKKSAGYHLDLAVVAVCIAINSLFGLPWFVAATVLSMNHIIALRKTIKSDVPGEDAKVAGIIEQRVTGLVIFSMIGASIFITDYLKHIPMPVLYAIFLYMGVTPMGELDFWRRILLIFMPKKHQPDYVFTRHVRLARVHLFTFIQILCTVILYALKSNKVLSITFPLMVVLIVFIRVALNYVFTDVELHHLDDILPPFRQKKATIEKEAPKNTIYLKVAVDEEKQEENENAEDLVNDNGEEEEHYENQELNFHFLESENKK